MFIYDFRCLDVHIENNTVAHEHELELAE